MKKILVTLTMCLLAFNASAQRVSAETIAKRAEWFNNVAKQELVDYAVKNLPMDWESYQLANAPKIFLLCYQPDTGVRYGRPLFSSSSPTPSHNTFNGLLGSAYCYPNEFKKIIAFQK